MEITTLISLIVQVSLILIVASVGLQARWRDLAFALSRPGLLLRGLIAVNLVVPLTATLFVLVLPVEPATKAGIVLMAVSPLAPFVPGKMIKAGAQASVAVGLYFALIMLAVLIVPATVALLDLLFPVEVSVPVVAIARFVLVSVLLPLAGGLVLAALLPSRAALLAKAAHLAGLVLLLPLVIGILALAGGQMLALIGNGTLAAIIVTVLAGVAAGHLLGGPEAGNRMALAAAASTRHPGIAALVAQRNFDDRGVMLAIVLFLLVSLVVGAVYLSWARRRLDGDARRAPARDGARPRAPL
jgi:BASS family bile acid:Na+ symporter